MSISSHIKESIEVGQTDKSAVGIETAVLRSLVAVGSTIDLSNTNNFNLTVITPQITAQVSTAFFSKKVIISVLFTKLVSTTHNKVQNNEQSKYLRERLFVRARTNKRFAYFIIPSHSSRFYEA